MIALRSRSIYTILLLCLSTLATAQKGKNELQIAAQLSFPTGDLKELTKIGHGYAVKGLWGIGGSPQQLTTEVGYSFFDIKDKWLTSDVHAYYGGFTINGGYRYRLGNLYIEPQAGIAFYQVNGWNSVTRAGVVSTQTYFDWVANVGYSIGRFDVGMKYQSAQVKNSTDITFFGLNAGYRINLSKKQEPK